MKTAALVVATVAALALPAPADASVICIHHVWKDMPEPLYSITQHVCVLEQDSSHAVIDPALCPVLRTMTPGLPGVVDITPYGDVYFQTYRVVDCPPYDF